MSCRPSADGSASHMQDVQHEVDLSRGVLKQVQDDYLIGVLNKISPGCTP
jgi:hypothetical protein